MMYEFRPLQQDDIPLIVSAFTVIGWKKPASIYQNYLKEQQVGQRVVWTAWQDKVFVGYVTLLWHSEYAFFRDQNIPEIKDLNVLPKFRNQGVGSQLIALAEEKAKEKALYIGLAVGLTADYGEAQKLYVKKGYIPNGRGLAYQNRPIQWGESVRMDDDALLYFIKTLS